ncbi:MAG: CCC motif membrane protein [Gillisia sp.]
MELQKQQLPNSTLVLVFGILSIVGCCCWGIVGLVFGIIAMVMAQKATELYNANPEIYTGYSNVKTGKILAIIGIVLSTLMVLTYIVMLSMFGIEELERMQQEMLEQYGG